MSRHRLSDAPVDVRNEVHRLVEALRSVLGGSLIGVYLHGSLALACFNPSSSDIDVLVVTREPMSREAKLDLMARLRRLSGRPSPIEISVVNEGQLHPWRHPAPFDFHYSIALEKRSPGLFADGSWILWYDTEQLDDDLAAHVTVARARGICLWGAPAAQALPEVPAEDYLDSLFLDIEWARREEGVAVEDRVLNICRVWAYLLGQKILSKSEGGRWALPLVPSEHRATVAEALRAYEAECGRLTARGQALGGAAVRETLEYLEQTVKELAKNLRGSGGKEEAG